VESQWKHSRKGCAGSKTNISANHSM
jgi:hypothetical protein